jgi:hypothetical protein
MGKKYKILRRHKTTRNKSSSSISRYWMVYNPEHPLTNSQGYVSEHRLVAERLLGRTLNKNEIIHHLNGDGLDNSPYNLCLCQSDSEHHLLHSKKDEFNVPLPNML